MCLPGLRLLGHTCPHYGMHREPRSSVTDGMHREPRSSVTDGMRGKGSQQHDLRKPHKNLFAIELKIVTISKLVS